MSDDAKKSSAARRKLFETQGFRREAAERLNLDRRMVKQAINALVEAGVVPCWRSDNAEALAVDGAWLLMGIGSRVRPDAIARVTPRFAEMTLQIDGDNPRGAPTTGVPSQKLTFEAELAAIFRNTWNAASDAAIPPVQRKAIATAAISPFGISSRACRYRVYRARRIGAENPAAAIPRRASAHRQAAPAGAAGHPRIGS